MKGTGPGSQPAAHRSKYHARAFRDPSGVWWDSCAEYRFYLVLLDRSRRGEVLDLVVKPRFNIVQAFTDWQGKSHRPLRYEADFQFTDKAGKTWVVDVKGFATSDYRIKRHLFMSMHPEICFVEVDARTLAEKTAG